MSKRVFFKVVLSASHRCLSATDCYTGMSRVGKSVKNSTDTIFEIEILAQKTCAKIRIKRANLSKKMQKFAKIRKILQYFFVENPKN